MAYYRLVQLTDTKYSTFPCYMYIPLYLSPITFHSLPIPPLPFHFLNPSGDASLQGNKPSQDSSQQTATLNSQPHSRTLGLTRREPSRRGRGRGSRRLRRLGRRRRCRRSSGRQRAQTGVSTGRIAVGLFSLFGAETVRGPGAVVVASLRGYISLALYAIEKKGFSTHVRTLLLCSQRHFQSFGPQALSWGFMEARQASTMLWFLVYMLLG